MCRQDVCKGSKHFDSCVGGFSVFCSARSAYSAQHAQHVVRSLRKDSLRHGGVWEQHSPSFISSLYEGTKVVSVSFIFVPLFFLALVLQQLAALCNKKPSSRIDHPSHELLQVVPAPTGKRGIETPFRPIGPHHPDHLERSIL
jgi:hypothetical protein